LALIVSEPLPELSAPFGPDCIGEPKKHFLKADEAKQWRRTDLQARAGSLPRAGQTDSYHAIHVDSTLALV